MFQSAGDARDENDGKVLPFCARQRCLAPKWTALGKKDDYKYDFALNRNFIWRSLYDIPSYGNKKWSTHHRLLSLYSFNLQVSTKGKLFLFAILYTCTQTEKEHVQTFLWGKHKTFWPVNQSKVIHHTVVNDMVAVIIVEQSHINSYNELFKYTLYPIQFIIKIRVFFLAISDCANFV